MYSITIYIRFHVLRMHGPITHMLATKSRKGRGLSDGNVALFGRQLAEKKGRERMLTV